jgi:hypothetical protein
VEYQKHDAGFSDSLARFHKETQYMYKDADIFTVGESLLDGILTAYTNNWDIGDFNKGDYIIALKYNTLTNESYFKTYKGGNALNIDINNLTYKSPESPDLIYMYVIATGFFSNNPDKITLYFSATPVNDEDHWNTIRGDFIAITLHKNSEDFSVSEYSHVPS